MQLEGQHIYKAVAQQRGIRTDLVKSIGDAVFRSFNELQKDPPNLILVLKGIGRRFIRRKKIHDRLATLERTREGIVSGDYRRDLKEIDDEAIKLRRILDWYDEFTEKRKYYKALRNEYQASAESSVSPGTVPEAGQDLQGERQRVHPGKP